MSIPCYRRTDNVYLLIIFGSFSILIIRLLIGSPTYNKTVLTYQALNHMTTEYVSNLLKGMAQTHTLTLRTSNNDSLYVPKGKHLYTAELFLAQHQNY